MKLVFESTSGASLWTVEAIREMCDMDRDIVLSSPHNYDSGCPSHSIGFYIGLLRDKDCRDIVQDDLDAVMEVGAQGRIQNFGQGAGPKNQQSEPGGLTSVCTPFVGTIVTSTLNAHPYPNTREHQGKGTSTRDEHTQLSSFA